jgi:diguanylate cyclase (GGDEF)-like protein
MMIGLNHYLSKRVQMRVYRVAGTIVLASVALSVILTNLIMEGFSAGINVQGLAVSILLPLLLGGPMTWFLVLRHEQLRHLNAQLSHMASTDWLTDCLNRGAFTRTVTGLLGSSAASRGALLIVDADDFKGVNDRFGHDVGDAALRSIADAIRQSVRAGDLVGRLGGEEFGVFLAQTDACVADSVAERIRHAVAAITFSPGGFHCPLSVSIGGATYASHAPFGDLYRLADQHLYEAKNAGRDRVAMMNAA